MSQTKVPAMTGEEMTNLLREEDAGCLSMSRGEEPYCVMVSYAFVDGALVFHCAKTGEKLDFIRANPRVCFLVSRHPDRTKPHHPEDGCTYRYESVLCRGTARVVEDGPELLSWLRKFKAHFDARLGLDPRKNPVGDSAAARAACVVIAIDRMTGRKKDKTSPCPPLFSPPGAVSARKHDGGRHDDSGKDNEHRKQAPPERGA